MHSLIKDDIIFNKLIDDEKFISARLVLTYVSFNDEVDTLNLIKYCLKIKKKLAVPKCIDNKMVFYYINSLDDLKVGKYNILEPITTDKVIDFQYSICVTPGLAFDKFGYRLGYGKGYYDCFFINYEGFKIGLCYKKCLLKKLYTTNNDIKVDKIITD